MALDLQHCNCMARKSSLLFLIHIHRQLQHNYTQKKALSPTYPYIVSPLPYACAYAFARKVLSS